MADPPSEPVRTTLSPSVLAEMRRSRRHPRLTQFDGLHLRRLLEDLAAALRQVPGPVEEMVDVFCGTRPYDDLFPPGVRCVGYDIDDHYGAADVVGPDFLPFDDAAFDLLTCIEGFHYVPDPVHGVSEFNRVLRPGGTALISIPLVWQYDRTILEHRYTGPELEHLFAGWDQVRVIENGGRGVSWATLSGGILTLAESYVPRPLRPLALPVFKGIYWLLNSVGARIDSIERTRFSSDETLPMNLLLTARKPH